MDSFLLISKMTLKELIRDKVLYYVFGCSIAVLMFSLFLGDMALYNKDYVIQSISMLALSLGGLFLSIFAGNSVLHKEIQTRTILVVFSRPIGRRSWLWGRFLGIWTIVGLQILLMGAMMLYLTDGKSFVVSFQALWLLACEQAILIAAVCLFAVLSSPGLAPMFIVGIYTAGHLASGLEKHLQSSQALGGDAFPSWMVEIIQYLKWILPPFDKFQVAGNLVHNQVISSEVMLWNSLTAFTYVVVLMLIAGVAINKRDFS